ncbi:hypothetical protein SNE40_005192 [Patella caerulea]|uniref:CUB domain-containing protein n=1 Tax=Patella caerulea TaxID=87958 RepID=A0AAN8PZQ2_PATCE
MSTFTLCMVGGLASLIVVSAYVEIRDLNAECGKPVVIRDSTVIRLEEDKSGNIRADCEVTLHTAEHYTPLSNRGFKVNFIDLNLPCHVGSVNFFYYDNHELQSSNAVCDDRRPILNFKSQYMTITLYKVDPNEFYGYFNFIVTNTNYDTCNSNETSCANGGCIVNSLLKDEYDNCGDGSDENGGIPTHEQIELSASSLHISFYQVFIILLTSLFYCF